MQPLVSYLLGQPHPAGKRLVDSQKCFRAQDIEEVGDNRHDTFFEMLGNWSLGDYFKKEQLEWIFEFLTRELGLDPKKLYVTVFEGNETVPKDTESIEIWKELFEKVGIKVEEGIRIFSYPASKNWWSRSGEPENMPPGEPGGPDSEIFFDFGQEKLTHENSIYKNEQCHPNCDCGRFLEIGNSVFMQYQKPASPAGRQADGSLEELPKKNVDFGGGLERLTMASENQADMFRTDLFWPLIQEIEKITGKPYEDEVNKSAMRVIADHVKAVVFLIAEDLEPSNKTQGYVLRRLLRRAMIKLRSLGGKEAELTKIGEKVFDMYRGVYLDGDRDRDRVAEEIQKEVWRFSKSLDKGLKVLNKTMDISGKMAFDLYQSYGFPVEITEELLAEKGQKIDKNEFEKEFEKHRELSRTAARGMFKGGLADRSEEVTKLHTVTHLLHAALRKYLGEEVHQVGSNITGERARFDFTYTEKLTDEQRGKIEDWMNDKIKLNLPIKMEIKTLVEAKAVGALAFFGARYGEKVNMYSIGDVKTGIVSKEVCGGPHIASTGAIGRVKLGKEEAVGAGRRRIYVTI